MGEPAKKLPTTSELPRPAGETVDANLDKKIGLEKTMLLNLQKLKVSATTVMKAEDLEYPDLSALSGSTENTAVLPDTPPSIAPEMVLPEIPKKSEVGEESEGLPDLDALSLNDDIDISDVTNSSNEDDSLLSNGFELDDESLTHGKSSKENDEDSDDADEEGDDVGEVTTKRDLVRLKRKMALEEKKKQRELDMKRQEEERKKREEYEKTNNILSIDALKRKADEEKSKTNVTAGGYEDLFGKTSNNTTTTTTTTATAKQLLTTKSTLVQPAPKQQTYSTENSGTFHGTSQGTASFGNAGPSGGALQGGIPMTPYTLGPPRKWYEALGLSIGMIVAEIFKIATPALIVGYFLLQQQDTNTSQKAVNHILSGNQFEMELGLSMLKTHFTPENNKHYYDLVQMKVEKDIEDVWKVEPFAETDRWSKLKEFTSYSFVDGPLNLPTLVKEKMAMHQKKVRDLYDQFYETEMKDSQSKTYVDLLRQANIFLTTGECVKSYDKFGATAGILPESAASLYGKVLSFNCAIMKDPQSAMDHIKKQMALVELAKIRSRVAEMNKTVSASDNVNYRAPASTNTSSSKKSKRY